MEIKMSDPDQSSQSFSSGRRWVFRLNFVLGLVALVALLVMVNYLGGGYYNRYHVDASGVTRLSPQTLQILELVTNKVEITIFFNPSGEEELYGLTADLLAEYKNANPKYISVKTLDYTRFDSDARLLLGRLNLLGLKDTALDFVLFESNGHSKLCHAKNLASWDINAALEGKALRRSAFQGERLFTSAIFSVIYPQPVKACFLSDHGERDPTDSAGDEGYAKLAGILKDELNTDWQSLSLHGTNSVPSDCQLLIVAGPRMARLLPTESERIDTYLKQGGRMLLLLDNQYTNSGAETILSQWGIEAVNNRVIEKDGDFARPGDVSDFRVAGLLHHPVLDAIIAAGNLSIQINSPRPFRTKARSNTPGEPLVSVLATSSAKSTLFGQPSEVGPFKLMVAIEQGVIKGINKGTRILAIGDSSLLSNNRIDTAANHTFAGLALNWLLERPDVLLSGLGPRSIKEYNLLITNSQLQTIEWVFLAGLPGLVFLIGGLVWLRRRR